MARLVDIQKDASAPHVIFHRLCDGETLRDLASEWKLPRGRFVEWFMTTYPEKYDAALKVRADGLVHDALDRAHGATPEDTAPRKLAVETNLKVAAHWDRTRYGAKDVGPAGGGITVIVDRSCGGAIAIQAGDASVLIAGAGGVSERVVNSSPEASALTATDQEI